MNILQSEAKQQKLVSWVAKIATLIVSAPATISVANQAYPEVEGFAKILVVGACVVLVEFAFLWFWLRVESNKANANKNESMQRGYVAGAWFMYAILLLAGLLHGEGAVAFLFRASMGFLLFVATRDRLLLTKAKLEDKFASGEYTSSKLLAAQRRADEQVAMQQIKKDKKLRLQLIEQDPEGHLERLAESNVFALLAEKQQNVPRIVESKAVEGPMETESYAIDMLGDEYEMRCKYCEHITIWPTRTQAARSGNAHSKMHKNGNGHKKVRLLSVENN